MVDFQTKPDRIQFEDVDVTNTKYLDNRFSQRRSTLFVTIADAQITLVDIEKMMETGMNVARFKSSHSTKGDKVNMIHKVDTSAIFLARKHGVPDWPCATCVELKTCVVETGLLEEEVLEITIKANTEIILTYTLSEFNKCNEHRIFVDNPYLTADVKVGMEINISQDEIIMKCTAIVDEKSIKCLVTKGGKLQNLAYVCMRGAKRTRPYLTKQDLRLLKFALEYQVDVIIINYVRHVETLKKIKQYLGRKLKRPMIIPGVCTQEGVDNIDDIIREADGILLSREFLAYEVEQASYNRINQIQRYIGGKCLLNGKPFYISGEVFSEALLTGNFCSREIADVTNAILDGVSGFVLKESPKIDYLIEVMKMMNELCASVEPLSNDKTKFWKMIKQIKMPMNAAEASAISCAFVANQTNARCIIVPTVTGRSVYLLNWLQPIGIIIAVSTKISTTRRLSTHRSVTPLLYQGAPRKTWYNTVQARVQYAIQYAVEKHWIMYGDHYVTLEKGTEESSFCDTVRVWNVTITKKNTIECPESYHDFALNTFAPKIMSVTKGKSDTETKGKEKKKRKKIQKQGDEEKETETIIEKEEDQENDDEKNQENDDEKDKENDDEEDKQDVEENEEN